MQARLGPPARLSLAERILVHLLESGGDPRDMVALFGACQDGIAASLHIRRSHVPRTLAPLVRKRLVGVALAHVPGSSRRRKTYFLTPRGAGFAVALAGFPSTDAAVAAGMRVPVIPRSAETGTRFPYNPDTRYLLLLETVSSDLRCLMLHLFAGGPMTARRLGLALRTIGGEAYAPPRDNTALSQSLGSSRLVGLVRPLVIQESGRSVRAWELARDGRTLGLPAARLALSTVVELRRTLAAMLGYPRGKGTMKPPHTRALLLEALHAAGGRLPRTQLASVGATREVLTGNLVALEAVGLVVAPVSRPGHTAGAVADVELTGDGRRFVERFLRPLREICAGKSGPHPVDEWDGSAAAAAFRILVDERRTTRRDVAPPTRGLSVRA